ncbi:MAG: type II secretion system F family protein [Candidatus Eremiobacteraeota bacterium]|nr:type II secretion system F family protein [Candidatus Eremiobacteraeota bacterium]MCW5868321.1 type II secretion system F family protein [Candidatus Eremiobacteraeota bacterium]
MAELSGFQLRVKGTNPPVVHQLEMRTYMIGRGVSGTNSSRPGFLFFADPTLSAEHAQIYWHDREMTFVLRHLSATNPSKVGSVTVAPGQARGVKGGDLLTLGSLELVFERVPIPEQARSKKTEQTNTAWDQMIQRILQLHPKNRKARVNSEELSVFTRQLSAMLDAGIPIARALHFFSEGISGGDLTEVVETLNQKVNSGSRLSHAMRGFPKIFSDVYVSLVETGEESGQLSVAMQRLADLLEKQVKMHKRIIATITYPLILLGVSVLLVSAFIFGILPMLEPMFTSMNVALPLPTRMLLASRLMMLPVASVLVVGGAGFWLFRPFIQQFLEKRPGLRKKVAKAPLYWPLVGPVMRKIAVARILYSMATMLEAGMTLVHSIARSARVTGNFWIEEQMAVSKSAVIDGETIADAFLASEIFPAQSLQLITIGEETSSLSTMVKYVADMYDEDADMALTNMANMLEPLLMGAMGVIAGFVVISAILPTLELINHL